MGFFKLILRVYIILIIIVIIITIIINNISSIN